MEKKIAIPVENGVLCAHFGHCQSFTIVSIYDKMVADHVEVIPPEHQPGLS
jgi:predicted Fe-Mo cluster-binding NifX family protein